MNTTHVSISRPGESFTAEEFIKKIGELDRVACEHETEAARLRKVIADIRDALNHRTRKPRTGKFSPKRKGKFPDREIPEPGPDFVKGREG